MNFMKIDFEKIFIETEALMRGHFILSSGKHSDTYFQCAKVLQYPKYLNLFAQELYKKFEKLNFDKVISPAIGGIVLGTEVGRRFDKRTIFCERESGKMSLRRGFSIERGEKILIIEDVLSTGGSIKEVINLITILGGEVIGVGVVVDRSIEPVMVHKNFHSLCSLKASIFDKSHIPEHLKNVEPIKPGSNIL